MEDIPRQIDEGTLNRVVQQMLNSDAARLDSWIVQRIDYASVSSHARGLYRLNGTAYDGHALRTWSLVLKVFAAPADSTADGPSTPFYWKREALAYQSGLLTALPGGLAAPHCYRVDERPDNQVWLWLEEIQPTHDGPWLLTHYGVAAHHFGTFGGAYLTGRPIPAVPWLSHVLIRAWVADTAPLLDLVQKPDAWEHPLLQRHFPDTIIAAVLRLWRERDPLLLQLDHLPQTICHQDVWRKNLFARSRSDGYVETVAIDWELVGLGAAGEDVGNLLGVSLLNFDVEVGQAAVLAETMLAQYLAGLGETGWDGDARAITYAFNTAAALRCVFSTASWPVAILGDASKRYVVETEQRWGRPIEDIVEHWAAVTRFLLDRADAARATLASL